jgi:hypothetical protein
MRLFSLLAALAVFLCSAFAMEKPSFHTQGTPTAKPNGPLKPGQYWWKPQLSPSGPLLVLCKHPTADHARLS